MTHLSDPPGDKSALLELFRNELQGHVANLMANLDRLRTGQYSLLIYDELMRIFHSIHGAAKLISLSTIASIATAAEHLFKKFSEKKAKLTDEEIEIISGVWELLRLISESEVENLILQIDSLKERFSEAIERIQRITPSDPAKESQLKQKFPLDDSSGKDSSDLIWKNFVEEVALLIEGLKEIRNPEGHPINLDQSLQSVKNLLEIGTKLQIPIVVTLTEALESCFTVAYNNQLDWTQGHIDLILEAVDFLSRLSEVGPDEIGSWLNKYEKGIESVAFVIAAVSREASVLEIPKNMKKMMPDLVKPTIRQQSDIKSEKQKSQLIDEGILDLFYAELEQRGREFNQGLLALENNPNDSQVIEGLMRAAHSIKGAARIVELSSISRLAHVMEDYFQSVKNRAADVDADTIDELLKGVDLFIRLSQVSHQFINTWISNNTDEIESTVNKIALLAADPNTKKSPGEGYSLERRGVILPRSYEHITNENEVGQTGHLEAVRTDKANTSYLRVSSSILNRLMGLAGESLVESRWLPSFSESLFGIKRLQNEIAGKIDRLQEYVSNRYRDLLMDNKLSQIKQEFGECRYKLSERLTDLELFSTRYSSLSDRLYGEVIQSRMRPFADGIESYPRMVRDLAKQLNKKVKLVIRGESTPVDREILEKLEVPIIHLLRNALDHGIESPIERRLAGKPEEGTIILEASHKAGMLFIAVTDDGRGVDIDKLRKKVIEKGFVSSAIGEKLNDTELLDFIFLPGFSTSEQVTEISGRGIGLNVVQTMVQEVGGTIKALGEVGLSVQMQLPLTLSVIRALLVEIAAQPYAIPLAHMEKVIMLPKDSIHQVEHRQYFRDQDVNIGLIHAHQVLNLEALKQASDIYSVIIVSDNMNRYGIVVDRFIGEKELVVQELDPILGKVPDIYGGAFMEDGAPVLIIDVEDMVHTIDKLLSKGDLLPIDFYHQDGGDNKRKRILVVDDSVTVREVEAKLLQKQGYDVDTAVNGVDGWNAVRLIKYDLVITDIDMPRMNGIEFLKNIRSDRKLQDLPVMIVSYKEREGDRAKGQEAGVNYFLTKSSFHDDTLLKAVKKLIG